MVSMSTYGQQVSLIYSSYYTHNFSSAVFSQFYLNVMLPAGIVLFIMLVGLPPFEWASSDDPRFRLIGRGGLRQLVEQWQRPISPDAIDLLQNMLREHPRDRLSLFQILHHPWVAEGADTNPHPNNAEEEDWRQYHQRMA